MAAQHQSYPKHYCGIFGIYGHPSAAELAYYGLFALQHRGQESAGIVACDGEQFRVHRGMGLVPQVFDGQTLHSLVGTKAIGHTRYSTTGSSHPRNAQPLTVDCARGQIAIAHNGNLTNAAQLRDELESHGSIFQTTVDSEIILHMMAQPSGPGQESTLVQAIRRAEGAFSLVIMTEQELIGVRDPHGFRPLSIGRVGDAYVLASETCAFDLIQAKFVREVEPGEIVIIGENGLRSIHAFPERQRRAMCVFEFVYFARPDSQLSGQNVHRARVEMGRRLARENPVAADIVVPVPDSGNCAALGYSLESGIPFEMAFVRNHYVGRSFLQPSQLIRDFHVRVKLNLITDLVKGRRVIIVDDSIVRGTTCKARVNAHPTCTLACTGSTSPTAANSWPPIILGMKSGITSAPIPSTTFPKPGWLTPQASPPTTSAWPVTTETTLCPTTPSSTSTSLNAAGPAWRPWVKPSPRTTSKPSCFEARRDVAVN
jgi:amidophosphoribosyltransferase